MQVVGTKAAFMQVINQQGFAKAYGVDKTIVSQWRSGKREPTLDKMEEILLRAGATVKSEKIWILDK